jgi:hypothetical protein
MEANNLGDYQAAFAALAKWLQNGGFPPSVHGLGNEGTVNMSLGQLRYVRQQIASGRYVIQTVEPNTNGPYEFVIYNEQGYIKEVYPLPME